jgi:hypothetical protein
MGAPGLTPFGGAGFSLQTGSPWAIACSGLTPYGDYPITGWLSGWCGAATGGGVRSDGKLVDVVWSGTTLTITGVANGILNMTLDGFLCQPNFPALFVGVISDSADACAGYGIFDLSSSPSGGTTGFWMGLTVGSCTATPLFQQFMAAGWLTGWCGGASGSGTTSTDQDITFTWNGDLLILQGQVVGALHVTKNPFLPGCENFLARGAVALVR